MDPRSPPPASAPPMPPSHNSETESLLGNSYQRGNAYHKNNTGVTNYTMITEEMEAGVNTGEDNWFEDEILGLALTEILKGLQWSNIISSALVIVLEVLVAIFRIFNPPRFILGCYLAFFASLILRVEIAQILKQHQEKIQRLSSYGGIGSHAKVPDVQASVLRDNFGLIFHPGGKATMLLLMCTMCLGQHNNILEVLLGIVFFANAFLHCYLLCRYAGYRRTEDIPIPKLPPLENSNGDAVYANTWSYYENDASSLWKVTSTIAEGSAMLTGSSKNAGMSF